MTRWALMTVAVTGLACGGILEVPQQEPPPTNPDQGENCNTSNCVGCCQEGVCNAGTVQAGCGINGESCKVCPGHQICNAEQACKMDPEQQWDLTVVSATLAPKNNGNEWDVDLTLPDPFTKFGTVFQTGIKQNTLQPQWNEKKAFAAKDLLGKTFEVQVLEDDLGGPESAMDKVPVTLTDAIFGSGTISIQKGAVQQLSITLTKQP